MKLSDDYFTIRNEFAAVAVRKNSDANGDRLELRDLRTGQTIFLDALELERLTAASHEDLMYLVAPPRES